MNLHPPDFYATEHFIDGQYYFLNETRYADGRTVPPDLLRDLPEQNYLGKIPRAFGFALMAIALLASLGTTIWVYLHHEHRVVKAAQPYFLYLICSGAAVCAFAIFPLSFDESYGWSSRQLSRACMSIPWISSLGYMLTYCALFSKLWRVNKVLQPVRRKIDIKQVLWPFLLLVALTVLILSLWTGLDPLKWEREEINSITGESIGQCQGEVMVAFLVPLIIVLLIPALLTGYMAWCTKDVDEACKF